MGTSSQSPASWRSAAVRHLNKLKTDGGRISQIHFRADGAFVSHSIKFYVELLTWPPPPEAQLRKTLTPLPKLQSSTLPTAKHQPTAKLHPLQMDPYCKVVSAAKQYHAAKHHAANHPHYSTRYLCIVRSRDTAYF